MELSKDDLELTLKTLQSQRIQTLISLNMIQSGIEGLERDLKRFKK